MPTSRYRKRPTLPAFADFVPSTVIYSDSVLGRVTCEVRGLTTKTPTVVFMTHRPDGTEACVKTLEDALSWL